MCSDGSRRFDREDPLWLRDDNDEELGPFPPIGLSPRGVRQAFETPNQTALYELESRFAEGVWSGTFRTIEGWEVENERIENGRPVIDDTDPNPDGPFLCDTGPITFSAAKRGG